MPVRTTEEMRETVHKRAEAANVVIMAAAVADYRPAAPHAKKIKRGGDRLTVELVPTPDILSELGHEGGKRVLVGFAAETDGLIENARAKLARKHVDMIVANDVTQKGAGFDGDTNIVTLLLRDGRDAPLPKMTKFEVANRILDHVIEIQKKSK
jgi:phosphopantothenoylcysteine decarboxylase/phosphopantothenate--cysteine ligase